ncbi:hypothetical protein F8M41_001878 [Gigaspora margarita]|uniref:Uncharacterized protein n=1 Tax=Gigaspora margarita TaxID=4874 RepID=A0A8H3XDR9_GIGMA|nr:hypothetical protein F8M41_001878 [Gigaspora margarita]
MKPNESDVMNPIKCNGHRQSSKGDTELNAIKLPKRLIRASKLQQQHATNPIISKYRKNENSPTTTHRTDEPKPEPTNSHL